MEQAEAGNSFEIAEQIQSRGQSRCARHRWQLAFGGVTFFALLVLSFGIGRLTASSNAKDGPSSTGAVCQLPGATPSDPSYCPFNGVDDLAGHKTDTLSGVPYSKSAHQYFRRIEWETVTVDDMAMAVDFYTNVLGGIEVDFCSTEGIDKDKYCLPGGGVLFDGSEHKSALFGFELTHGEHTIIVDIDTNGEYQVISRFFVFGNGVVQLLQFSHKSTQKYFDLRESRTSPCWVGAGHIDWWIDDDVDMNDFIESAEQQGKDKGMVNLAWNRPVPQQTRADRATVPKSSYANKVPVGQASGAFGGLEWSYFKGPVGDQQELYKITGTMKEAIGRAYCDRGAVCSAFVDESPKTGAAPLTTKMHGVFQFGFRTDDLHAAVAFYTEVLGGDLITYPTHGINIHEDSAHWMILANETVEAYEKATAEGISREEAMMSLGVANLSSTGPMRLDHRFILFDNFVVEPLLYTNGLSFGGQVFAPRWNHSTSPAYIGITSAAFGGSSDKLLEDSLATLKTLTAQRGFPEGVSGPWIPNASFIGSFVDNHPFFGLEYAYGKGQSGESLAFVRVSGLFQKALKAAFDKAGHVSTMFDSTNAFKDGRMDKFCKSVLRQPVEQ